MKLKELDKFYMDNENASGLEEALRLRGKTWHELNYDQKLALYEVHTGAGRKKGKKRGIMTEEEKKDLELKGVEYLRLSREFRDKYGDSLLIFPRGVHGA